MNRLARLVDLSGIDDSSDAPALLPVPLPPGEPPAKYYQALVSKLCQERLERGCGVITAFTSVSNGDGVTHVVERLAMELAATTMERVLLASAAGLHNASRVGFRISDPSSQERVFRMEEPVRKPMSRGRGDGLQELRMRFGFVLVDCPPLSVGPAAPNMSKITDNVVLVVRAGKTTYPEVTWAHRSLTSGSVNVLGLVLNGTAEAIPRQ